MSAPHELPRIRLGQADVRHPGVGEGDRGHDPLVEAGALPGCVAAGDAALVRGDVRDW